ncbi:MAG: Glu-tRNA(Gln) amidotransferase subunit GatE [Bacteroidales bacterium]|jgi:glutamyl-tRNA(Gln) amidotransferase subunit E|nr:Glu-tRNA(Gln) amidotransferase subunit GatE [Bacteroidales bacterium]
MKKNLDALRNYRETLKAVGYVPRKKASQKDYDRIGFMSGLEVHQQLDTKRKLFCRCPCGIYHGPDDYDAEVIRHMRPTLSELGEYDGTALMEFKTRKEIIYRIKNATTCTYEVDDTPPFPLNREALDIAIQISLLKKLNIVGEVHITRKQYLDGSIPTGFQRTAIIGVEGEIELPHKKIRLIQLSLEEDSCREVSDIGHTRIYRTDRLGMPLIETVTYPDMVNPDEVAEACQFIRFLNRSTGKVRTGMGAARQDVNVSCRGGSRVEIKGVAHIKWIPELTHIEAFRQWALLHVREQLLQRVKKPESWKMTWQKIDPVYFDFRSKILKNLKEQQLELYAVCLPRFGGILSHFSQPGKVFADEISERLKVIACIEKPNMTHSEDLKPLENEEAFTRLRKVLGAKAEDGILLFWGPEADIPTALDTIEERCRMAFVGVPNETRKSFEDGSTIFERVLPGADRMYPDTDSAPIPLKEERIQRLSKDLPMEAMEAYRKMQEWKIPEDTYLYILKKNLFPVLKKMVEDLMVDPVFAGTLLGHRLPFVEGHYEVSDGFSYEQLLDILREIQARGLDREIIKPILPVLVQHPKMDFDSILVSINFKSQKPEEVLSGVRFLKKKYASIGRSKDDADRINWMMGQLRKNAVGNIALRELHTALENGK